MTKCEKYRLEREHWFVCQKQFDSEPRMQSLFQSIELTSENEMALTSILHLWVWWYAFRWLTLLSHFLTSSFRRAEQPWNQTKLVFAPHALFPSSSVLPAMFHLLDQLTIRTTNIDRYTSFFDRNNSKSSMSENAPVSLASLSLEIFYWFFSGFDAAIILVPLRDIDQEMKAVASSQ